MKKINATILFVALGALTSVSCQTEKVESSTTPVTITFGLSQATKATFDEEGIKWSSEDVIRFTNEGFGDAVDIPLSGHISADGYTATVTAEFPAVTTAVFRMNYSPRNNVEWDYGYMGNYCGDGSSFTEYNKLIVKQSEAGQINKKFLFLHSGLTSLPFDSSNPPTTVEMEILGTIIRVLPYTTDYNDEEIESVVLSTSSGYGLGGCTAVNYSAGTYRDQQDINWGPDRFSTYEVDLTTPLSLSGVTGRSTSKGIYFALPATNTGHEISGYTITVNTDKAVYTFDGSAKSLDLDHNKVRNIYLDLGNADSRVANSDMYGIYWFDGNISSQEYSSAATDVADLGYWVAYYQNTLLGDDAVRAGEPNAIRTFYDGLSISAVDSATGDEPTWLTYGYSDLSVNSHWSLHLLANTGIETRTATITIAPAASVAHYTLRPGEPNKVITITQLGDVTLIPTISSLSSSEIVSEGGSVTATLGLTINGTPATDEQFETYVSQVSLTSTSGTVTRVGRTITLTLGVNPKTVSRDIRISATTKDGSAYVDVTQAASAVEKVYTFTYVLTSGWNTSSCKPRQLYFGNAADSGRQDWVIIVESLAESGVAYTPGAAFDPDAVEPLIKKVLGLSDSQYTEMSEWLSLDVYVLGAQWIIVVEGFEANGTGASRSISGSFYEANGSVYEGGSYLIQQNT